MLIYFNFELSFKLRWFRVQDLLGSQIPVTTGGNVVKLYPNSLPYDRSS